MKDSAEWHAARIQFCYEAGKVRRWHTSHVIQEETVAAHTWSVLTCILLLHPDPSVQLLRAAAMHDVSEVLTGDVPRWAKRESPSLKHLLGELEDEILDRWDLPKDSALSPDDQRWLKVADLFDAWMFLRYNLMAGNMHLRNHYHRALQALRTSEAPVEIQRVYEYLHHTSTGAES